VNRSDHELASDHRLEALLGCTKGLVFELDRDGRYLNVWTRDESLLTRPMAELVGRTIDEVLGASGRMFIHAIRRVFDTGEPETLEYELHVKGERHWFIADVVVSPTLDKARTVIALVRDITAHKQLEEQLRQAQKMEAIGRLAGGIAHDFNNILTTILGYSEMLLDGLGKNTALHKHASRIRHAAERASALTNQLLAYGRKQVLVFEVLCVNTVIATMAQMLGRLIGEHIELELELSQAVGGTKIDRGGLEQVIMNLALNARDALANGGRLILRTDTAVLDEAFCANQLDLVPGRYVRITVSDNGHGMDAATRDRVFEPFFTTKAVGTGTGLGLSTVYGIVKQSSGHIEVESQPGDGATFRVYLPWVEVPPQVATTTRPATTASQYTVLVVEDDPDVGQLVYRYLSGAGYQVELITNPERALERAGEHPIDVLVTDLVMPKMSGSELAERVSKLQPDIRILYISGYPADAHSRVPNSLYLQKPFTRQSLVREIGALFDRR
jgi:two-component system, cell cycle sensor histidine kinase and response regulator CckA